MGLFVTRAVKQATEVHDTQHDARRAYNPAVELFLKKKDDLLKDLNELLGETFVEENIIVNLSELKRYHGHYSEEFFTVKIPIGPKGVNHNVVGTLLVFKTNLDITTIFANPNGNYSHIELKGPKHRLGDLIEVFDRWDKFTQ